MFKIVILAGSAHNFNFSVNSCMLVKVACLKTFEEVMNGNNSTAVVAREEDKARSKHRRILKNWQNKTSLENAGGLGRSEPRNMDADPILNQAKTRSRRNTLQGRYNEQRGLKTSSRKDKRQERFFYRGGSWHGKESTRYRTHHIKKSMQFLESNMQE